MSGEIPEHLQDKRRLRLDRMFFDNLMLMVRPVANGSRRPDGRRYSRHWIGMPWQRTPERKEAQP